MTTQMCGLALLPCTILVRDAAEFSTYAACEGIPIQSVTRNHTRSMLSICALDFIIIDPWDQDQESQTLTMMESATCATNNPNIIHH